MAGEVGIIGIGYEGFRPAITDVSTRELMYLAASKAYADAGVDPRKDVGSFICCTEDFWEGWSIADEMVPDQVGGARRPVCTVPGDGIIGLGHAVMHIRAGVADVVSVEAHSKVADVLDKRAVENLGLDPVYHRVTGANTDILAGLEMSAFMRSAALTREDISEIVATEKERALRNERASYGGRVSAKDVSEARPVAEPLRRLDIADFAEAGFAIILASGEWIRKHRRPAVSVDGISWRSSAPWHDGGSPSKAEYAELCFRSVLKQSGKRSLASFDVAEVDDLYSYKLPQHLMAMGATKKETQRLLEKGEPLVNPSGGSLGCGQFLEATGLHKVAECVLQLRGEAGGTQVRGAKSALALSWRGHPTATGAAIALSAGGRSR